MNTPKQLIEGRPQIILLVDSFYAKVRQDGLIGPIFTEQANVNWDEHLPKLYSFWEDLLFGTMNYRGRPFPPHLKFNLKIEHFDRWLSLFSLTVDEHFYGQKADEAKARAQRIGQNFLHNIRTLTE